MKSTYLKLKRIVVTKYIILLKYIYIYINVAYGKDDLNIILFIRAYGFGFIITFINDKYKYNYYYFILYKIGIFGIFRNYKSVKEYGDYKIYYLYINKNPIYINGEFTNYYFEYSII